MRHHFEVYSTTGVPLGLALMVVVYPWRTAASLKKSFFSLPPLFVVCLWAASVCGKEIFQVITNENFVVPCRSYT